jgi:hypothetical protein
MEITSSPPCAAGRAAFAGACPLLLLLRREIVLSNALISCAKQFGAALGVWIKSTSFDVLFFRRAEHMVDSEMLARIWNKSGKDRRGARTRRWRMIRMGKSPQSAFEHGTGLAPRE